MNNGKISMITLCEAFEETKDKQKFDQLFADFSQTAGKKEFAEWYEDTKEDPNRRFPDSWCTLYCDVWKLVPACQEPDVQKRKQYVLDEMQNILIKNMEFCENGLISMNDKYLVLNMMIDIFMAGWFKNKLSLPAVLYSWMRNKNSREYDRFYGEAAKLSIVSYVCEKLSEEERKDLQARSRVIAEGPMGDFELAVRRYCNTLDEARQKELSQRYQEVKNFVPQRELEKEEKQYEHKQQEFKQKENQERELKQVQQPANEKVDEGNNGILSFVRNNIILVVALGACVLLGFVFILIGVFGKGKDKPDDLSEYKEQIEILIEENEELKKQLELMEEELEKKELGNFVDENLDDTTSDEGDISVKADGEEDGEQDEGQAEDTSVTDSFDDTTQEDIYENGDFSGGM